MQRNYVGKTIVFGSMCEVSKKVCRKSFLKEMTDSIAGNKVVELGKGRFAKVECWRMADGSLVAVKVFSSDNYHARDKELKVLNLIGVGSHYTAQIATGREEMQSNLCCIGLKAYLGGSLNKHIQQCGSPFPLIVVRNFISELLSALAYLESVECIHRDIKSTNCVLDHTGRLKLCDFGSATVLGTKFGLTTHRSRPHTADKREPRTSISLSAGSLVTDGNRAYTITGTAVIMAPEMAAASIGYDYAVDYWAVGVLLYEMLSCRLPAFDRTPFIQPDITAESKAEAWPSANDSKVAIAAIELDVVSEPADCPFTTSDPRPLSRPSTASKKQANEVEHISNKDEDLMHQAALQSWFLSTVDPTFGTAQTSTTPKKNANADLNAILGNFSFTPKKSKDDIAYEHAVDLVRSLLTVNPNKRLSRLVASNGRKHIDTAPNSSTILWNQAVRMHPFFAEVDWAAVDSGLSPPANSDFDRRLGCMELLEEFDDANDELTAAQQALFDGF